MIKKLTRNKKTYWGDLSGVQGDLADCKITDKNRDKGISIDDLIVNS